MVISVLTSAKWEDSDGNHVLCEDGWYTKYLACDTGWISWVFFLTLLPSSITLSSLTGRNLFLPHPLNLNPPLLPPAEFLFFFFFACLNSASLHLSTLGRGPGWISKEGCGHRQTARCGARRSSVPSVPSPGFLCSRKHYQVAGNLVALIKHLLCITCNWCVL